MGKTTVADITELARHIEAEQKYLARLTARASANLVDGGLTAADKVRLHADIREAGIHRELLCEKLRSMAGEAPENVAAILYHAATKLHTGCKEVPELLAAAAAAMGKGPEPNGRQTPIDLISFDDIHLLLSVSLKTVRNNAVKWKAECSDIADPCSYATIRPLILKQWPTKAAAFPVDYEAMRDILKTRSD